MNPVLPGNIYPLSKDIIMKTKLTTTALILASSLIAGFSHAESSGLTREAVMAEYYAARQAGTLPKTSDHDFGANWIPAQTTVPSTLTREAVMAEYYAARQAGTLPKTGDHDFGANWIPAQTTVPSALTREAVMVELYAARKAGTLPKTGSSR